MATWHLLTIVSFTLHLSPFTEVSAAQLPSLFRGVMVVNGPLGVRVVSVEETSQAFLSDLRSEDVILQINGTAIHTIDEFAAISQQLKGRAAKATLLVLRNDQLQELTVHLYSVPVLQQWDLSFVPEHDIRFADPTAGVAYWMRLARGFQEAGDLEHALNAVLNALHNDPGRLDVALRAADLLWAIARAQLARGQLSGALAPLDHGTTLLERLMAHSLTVSQLQSVRHQLEETVAALRHPIQTKSEIGP